MTARSVRLAVAALIVATLISGAPPTGPAAAPSTHVAVAFGAATPLPEAPNPFSSGMPASVVLGQSSFTGSSSGASPNASNFGGQPNFAKLDARGDLWVADFGASRVLEYLPPFTTGEAASLVIGQSNFTGSAGGTSATNLTTPAAVAFDTRGDLWVSSYGNDRVLEFRPPFTDGMAASLVLGVPSFNATATGATSAQTLGLPADLNFDPAGNLWVADAGNNRVLEFQPPFSDGMAASRVLGQTVFTGNFPGLSAVNLSHPLSVWPTASTVWVADYANGRVLGYPAPPTSGESASVVLGQVNFTSATATGAASLAGPSGVTVDAAGHVWVSAVQQARVVEFPSGPSTFATPLVALGQSTLTGEAAGATATNLSGPVGVCVGPSSVFVSDSGNYRLLEYVPSRYDISVSESGLPLGSTWSFAFDNTTVNATAGIPTPFGGANGTYVVAVHAVIGYAADPAYAPVEVNGAAVALVVRFLPTAPNPFSNGMPATVVLGQTNFWSSTYPQGPLRTANASTFGSVSYAMAFDAAGDLWIADWSANRVLEFVPPFATGMSATLVLGQATTSGLAAGTSATNLSEPDGLAFDPAGNLWVADYGNNRVVEFPTPFVDGEAASVVVGQANFTGETAGHTASSLSGPSGIAFDGSTLWVTDYVNDRVLAYPAPQTSGESATVALGQTALNTTVRGTTATNLASPSYLAFDTRGNAWVADDGNGRAVEFTPPFSTGEAASVVLGQTNFTSSTHTQPYELGDDNGLALDARGNLWVADSGRNRVVEYAGPTFTTNQTPILVVGQGNLSTYGAATGPRGLDYPTVPVFDPRGDLWVVDQSNNRVLGYVPPTYTLSFDAAAASAPPTWNLTVNGVTSVVHGATWTLSTPNSTFRWSVSAPGWTLAAYAGTVAVNGASTAVLLAFSRATYAIEFEESGLASGTRWSVTVGGFSENSTTPGIVIDLPNGTYGYTVGAVAGYTISPASGSLTVAAGAVPVSIAFQSSAGVTGGIGGSTLLGIGLGLLAVVVLVGALLLYRRKRSRPPPPKVVVSEPPCDPRVPPGVGTPVPPDLPP